MGACRGLSRAPWKPARGFRWLKVAEVGPRCLRGALKHESFVKHTGFGSFRRALQVPRKLPEGPRQALSGPLGVS